MHSSLSPGLCFPVSSLEVTGWSRDEALLPLAPRIIEPHESAAPSLPRPMNVATSQGSTSCCFLSPS